MKKKVSVLRLGTECPDKATGLTGTITHWLMDLSGRVEYLFQPKGLDEEGVPLKKLYLCAERLKTTRDDLEQIEVPFEILGTQVADKASGFEGMAVEFIRHINGCFHVVIQPYGMSAKSKPIPTYDFDLRQCTGEKIPVLSEEKMATSRTKEPSPSERPPRELHCAR